MTAVMIHVVDDDDLMAHFASSRLLGARGHAAKAHASAGSFLMAAPRDCHGCILLDLHMPGPSGLESQVWRFATTASPSRHIP